MTVTSMRAQPPTDVLEIEEPEVKIPWWIAGAGLTVGALIDAMILGFAAYAYVWTLFFILVIGALAGVCAAQYVYNRKLRNHHREAVALAHQRMDDIRERYEAGAPTTVLAAVPPPEFTDQLQEHRLVVLETVLAALKSGKTTFSQSQREQLEGMAHALLDPARTEFKFTQERTTSAVPAGLQAQISKNWTPVIQVVSTWASDPGNQWTFEEIGIARAIAKEVTAQQAAMSAAATQGAKP